MASAQQALRVFPGSLFFSRGLFPTSPTMHKFFTLAPKPSALTVLRDPQAGAPMLLAVQYSTPAVPDPQAGAPARLVRTAFSTPRYENLCIIRARMRSHKDQTNQTLVAGIIHSMKLIRESASDFPRLEHARFLADGERAFPFNDVVDFVVPIMAMNFLHLPGFQTIDVAKHSPDSQRDSPSAFSRN